MDKIFKYRKSHHRCRYCKFLEYGSTPVGPSYERCKLKDRALDLFFYELAGMFCRWYESDLEGDDISEI